MMRVRSKKMIVFHDLGFSILAGDEDLKYWREIDEAVKGERLYLGTKEV